MFYSQIILARKGPLGKIWLAAHWDKKLTKTQIYATDISESVENILSPSAPLALRVSGHLMLGIVRIYSRKVKYLMSDCTEAMWKIKMAFRPGNVDLAEANLIAAASATDDPRFFGMIQPEVDFPELADVAFSEHMLMQYDELRAARGRTLGLMKDNTIDDFGISMNLGNRSPMSVGGVGDEDEGSHRSSGRASPASDIEIARRDGSRGASMMGVGGRPSLSSLGMGAGRYDDDIPAYDDQDMMFGDDVAPPMDQFDDVGGYDGDAPFFDGGNGGVYDDGMEQGAIGAGGEEQEQQAEEIPAVKSKPRKKQRIIVDDRIELSAKTIKQNLKDRSDILRRLPGGPLAKRRKTDGLTDEDRLMRSSDRGLCPELSEIFTMILGPDGMPFARMSAEEEDEEEEALAEDIEVGRDGADGHLDGRGRPSLLSGADSRGGADMSYQQDYGDDYQDYGDDYPTEFQAGGESPSFHGDEAAHGASRFAGRFAGVGVGEEGGDATSSSAWSGRTAKVREILCDEFREKDSVSFAEVTSGVSKRLAAACFLEVLQLQTWGMIKTAQENPLGDFEIKPTPQIWT